MNTAMDVLANELLSALVNGTCQGLLLTGVIALLLKVIPQTNAATRHAVALATLLSVAGLPVFLFFWQPLARPAVERGLLGAQQMATVPGERTTPAPAIGTLAGPEAGVQAQNGVPHPLEAAQEGAASVHGERATRSLLRPRTSALRTAPSLDTKDPDFGPEPSGVGRQAAATPAVISPTPTSMDASSFRIPILPWSWRLSLPRQACLALLGLWLVLALARLIRLAWQCGVLHRLNRCATPTPAALETRFGQLCEEMGVRRRPRLRLGDARVPMVLGFWRPMVLLPQDMPQALAPNSVDHILRHELAHVRRYDDWWNLAQQIISAVLFFDPAVSWLCRRLSLEREIACDDHVLGRLPNARAYAWFLTEFAGRAKDRLWLAAPAAWSNNNQLKERVAMILNSTRNSSPQPNRVRVGILTTTAAALAVLGLYACPRLAFAQDAPAPRPATSVAPAKPAPPASAAASVNAAPVVVATEPETPPAAWPDAGPKLKPPATPHAPNVLPTPPAAPARARAAIGLPAPMLAQSENVPPAPVQQSVTRPRRVPRDESIEARLDRLERLVESLLAREKRKTAPEGANKFQLDPNGPYVITQPNLGDLPVLGKLGPNPEELSRFTEQTKRAADQARLAVEEAMRQAKAAVDQAQRAARDAERMSRRNEKREFAFEWEGLPQEARRQALEDESKALDKQIQAMAQQLSRLKQQQERIRRDLEKNKASIERNKAQNESSNTEPKNEKPGVRPDTTPDSQEVTPGNEKKVKR